MADFTKFRSAVGGFNRSDVTEYMEKLCAEHAQEMKALREENAVLADRLAAAQSALDSKAAENDALQRKVSETEIALASTEAALEEAMTMIEEQDALVAKAAAEEAEREETPDYPAMELEAYRRAEATERLAAERANRLTLELSDLLDNISGRYEQTGQEIQVLTEDIRTNLQRLQEALSDLDLIFEETTGSFNTFDAEAYNSEEEAEPEEEE